MWGAIKTICLAPKNWLASCVVLFFIQELGPTKTTCLSQINCSVCLPSVKLASAGFRGNKACNVLRRSFCKLPRPKQSLRGIPFWHPTTKFLHRFFDRRSTVVHEECFGLPARTLKLGLGSSSSKIAIGQYKWSRGTPWQLQLENRSALRFSRATPSTLWQLQLKQREPTRRLCEA